MARPRKDSDIPAANERMVEAFWNQLSRGCYADVTVTSITREVGCNRATFYYHFDSIDDLASYAVQRSVPREIITIVEKVLSGQLSSIQLDNHTRRAIERLCLLAGEHGSNALVGQLKSALQHTWARYFHLDVSSPEMQAVITFMSSGIVGVLGAWANKPIDDSFDTYLQPISQVFSAPAIRFAQRHATVD